MQRIARHLALLLLLLGACAVLPAAADDSRLERGIAAYEAEDYERAYKLLKPEAEAETGAPEAKYYVGEMYAWGRGVEQDLERSVQLAAKAAEQGNPDAQRTMGYVYYEGIVVEEDHSKAADWYRRAGESGDPAAQRAVGLHYKDGEGVERDYEKAAEWFRRAAEQGDGTAAMELGRFYRHGRGVGQDFEEAAYWNRKAMRAGYQSAQRLLAWQYFAGKGVDQDLEEAELLYRDLVEDDADDVDAQFALGLLLQKRGQDEDDEAHLAEAYEWLRKAASHGDAQAMLHVGAHHSNGWGVKRDNVEAQAWAMLSEAHGNTEARGLIEHTTRYAHDADPERAETRASEIARELGLD